ncbi:MAG: hypothetical protein LPK45_11980 [Bacteroidota bacterium]|nr:hypothetical protein [Bacteroidota bacterium]MDX5431829.1 hypothetical protein [Bacteroidota bacterium]MDX5470542.1 hypothetical protein [Bacteroidota bacterium]
MSRNPEAQAFLEAHIQENPAQLSLRFSGKVNFNLPELTAWLDLLQKAEKKLPSWSEKRC